MARLIFPRSSERTGFISDSLSRRTGDEYEVVRELVQNSLDAAREARRSARVMFTIKRVPIGSIPGIEDYREAFEAAAASRGQSGLQTTLTESLSNHEVNVIDRIRTLIEEDQIPILLLRDNGIGLNENTLHRVLSESLTTKADTGNLGRLGSWGVGHMAAFGASGLRYVLYAGRSKVEDNGSVLSDASTGEAILAAHEHGGQIRSPKGYWVESLEESSLAKQHQFSINAPQILASELDQIETTGSVVCMTGFNWFNDDDQTKAADKIARVVALNFVVAIHREQLIVEVHDEVHGRVLRVERGTLGAVLEGAKDQRRARAGGQIAGGRAHAAHETLLNAKPQKIEGGVLYVREAKLARGASSHVNLFRDGMWITNSAPRLGTADFGGTAPFDAILALDQSPNPHDDDLYELVRSAEGAEHRDLKRTELTAKQWATMTDQLRKIGDDIRAAVGAQVGDEQIVEGFAQIDGAQMRDATALPPLRPRHREGDTPIVTPIKNGPDEPEPPNPNPKPAPDPDRARRARAVNVRSTMAPHEATDDGHIRTIRVVWTASEAAATVGVRLRVDSGSDSTCEVPFSPGWLRVTELTTLDGATIWKGDAVEATVSTDTGSFIINLAEPLADLTGVELDVVVTPRAGRP